MVRVSLHVLRYLCLAALLMGLSFESTHAKEVLIMNHQFPESAAGSQVDKWFADQVKSATKGEVEIRIFWSNKLGEPRDNLYLLRSGDIDMAAMSAGYFPKELPFYSAPNSIPMAMDDICQSSEIMKAFMEKIPAFKEETGKYNIRPLFFHLLNPYLLVTKEPVTEFSQLEGMRIRTWGKDMPRLFEAAQAKPINLFLPDIKRALEEGVIDGCPFSPDLVVSYGIHEVAKHITQVVLWEGPSWGVWINENAWSRISPANQKVILGLAEKARLREIPLTQQADEEARSFLMYEGVLFHDFPDEEVSKWRAASPDFFSDFVRDMEKLGKGDEARKTVQLWKQLRSDIQCPGNFPGID